MTLGQNPISLVPIDTQAAGWDVVLQNNTNKLNLYIKTFKLEVTVDGDTGTPSEVTIQLQNSKATPEDVIERFFLRLRVTDDDGGGPGLPEYADATNATISAVTTGTIVETKTASKDLVIQSDPGGVIVVELTDAVAELFWLVLGAPDMMATFANYENAVELDHT